MSNDLNKQATVAAIERINAVEGFDPSVLAVDYSDLSSNETRRRLPVMSQMAWFRLKYPEGRIAVTVTAAKDCFVASARIYAHYNLPPDQYLAEATASRAYCVPPRVGTDRSSRYRSSQRRLWPAVQCGR